MERPSKCKEVNFKINSLVPPKGFFAITLFGTVYIHERNKEQWERIKDLQSGKETKWHETIHVKQAQMEKDSWFVFYLKYLGFWLKNMFYCGFNNTVAYYTIPYEMEAYGNENYFNYNMKYFEDYKNMSTKERIELYKKHSGTWREALKKQQKKFSSKKK